MIREKKTLTFPFWVEAILIVALLVMTIVEGAHGAWGWVIIFGIGFLAFGISALTRALSGGKHGRL